MTKKTIRIDPNIFNFFFKEGCLKELSQFIYLKTLNSNSCIFNYSKKSLASQSGLSANQVDKLVKFFISSGWCRMHCGNLIFNSLRNKAKHRDEMKIQFSGDWKEIKEDIQLYILKKKQSGFEAYKRLGVTLNNPRGGRQYKAAFKKASKLNIHPDNFKKLPCENDFFKISIQKVASLFNCSVGAAYNLINRLRIKGKAFCMKFVPVPHKFSNPKALSGVVGGGYYSNGCVFVVQCNQYDFNN